jgi:hypothetical protein
MPEFFEFCLRKITSIDDAPTPESRRGAHFEQAVWTFLNQRLSIDLVVDLNTRLRAGTTQGEIDIAFRCGDAIVVLECKSWQKRIAYFRGDRASIVARHAQLGTIVDEQVTRNVALLRARLGSDAAADIVAFVCVAGPEFITRGYPGLWYGTTPRVLTPVELVELLNDRPRWRATIEAHRRMTA